MQDSYKTLPYQRSDATNVNKIMKNHKAQPNNITPFELRELISIRGDILLSQWKKGQFEYWQYLAYLITSSERTCSLDRDAAKI